MKLFVLVMSGKLHWHWKDQNSWATAECFSVESILQMISSNFSIKSPKSFVKEVLKTESKQEITSAKSTRTIELFQSFLPLDHHKPSNVRIVRRRRGLKVNEGLYSHLKLFAQWNVEALIFTSRPEQQAKYALETKETLSLNKQKLAQFVSHLSHIRNTFTT